MELGGICHSPLWNQSVSWDTNDPYISNCFKHIVLVIGSCAVLWIVAPLEFVKIFNHRGTNRPWTKLAIAKITCKILLLIVCVVEFAKELYAYINRYKYGLDGLIAAVAFFVTIVLTVVLTMMCKRRGLRSSLVLPSFWMISTVTTIITLYDDIHAVDWGDWITVVSLVDDCFTFVISVIQLVLSSMSEEIHPQPGQQNVEQCPLEGESLVSRLSYSWILSVLSKGSTQSLHNNHLIKQCHELGSHSALEHFKSVGRNKTRANEETVLEPAQVQSSSGGLSSQTQTGEPSITDTAASLFKVLGGISKKYLIISSITEVLYCGLYYLPLYMLKLILDSSDEERWHRYVFAIGLFFAMMLVSFADSQRKYYALFSAFKIKTAVSNAAFEKALVSLKIQDIKTIVEEDAECIFQMACFSTEVWGAPVRLIAGLYLLWFFLGSASFIGIAVAVIFLPLTNLLEGLTDHFYEKSFNAKEEHLAILKEIIYKIKVIKIYAWEMFFQQRLMKTRKLELGPLRKAILFKFFSKFQNLSSTMIVTLCTLSIYVVMEFSVSVKAVFIGFYLIYLLKTPFSSILFIFTSLVQGTVSMSRVEKFLGEKNVQTLFSQKSSEPRISLKDASFTWESDKTPCVKKFSLQAADSCLIAVVGGPQSGKTSFLQALLGQLQKLEGYACVKGDFSYVSDPPWIQNATVENNILFLKAKDEVNYKETLKACDLLGDIEILPDGDQTEIGEKGYLLNDDQKVKMDLARAVYKDADIYLLDEPLRKAKHPEHLFQRVIGHNGMLKNKIRVFTSSDASFVSHADQVLYLENGFVVEQGRYSELIEKKGLFSKYVNELPDSNDKILTKHSTKVLDDALDTKDETVRGYCDPWYSTSPMSLKPSLESRLFSDVALEPKGLFGYLLKYAKINGFFLTVVSVVLAIAACCFEVVSWIWWTKWTPESILKDDVYKHLYEYVGLITAQVLCNALCGIVVFISSTLAVARLYKWLLNRVLKASHTAFGPNFIDKVFQSFNHDLRDADESVPLVYYVWLMIVFKAPVLLFLIYFKAPLLIILHSPLIIAYFVIQKLYLNSWRQLHHLTSSTRFPLSNLLNEALHGMPSIRAYGSSSNYFERFQGKLDIHNNCYFTFLLASRWLSCCLDIIGSIFVLTTSLTLLIEKSLDDNFIGLLIVFSMQISEHLLALIYVSSLLETNFPTLERLTSFSSIKQESEWENPSNKLPSSWPTSGLICIENLCAAYGDAVYPALNSINLLIQPKQKVVIRSEDKDGIYALLDSLFRIREVSPNEIFIDSIDIRGIGLQDLRCRLGFVPQEPLVFDGTFRENMDPMNQFSDAEVWDASKIAELDWCFSHLDEPVRKDLSLEVKKRMSYARCFLKKSKVVVLEQPEGLTAEAKALFSSSTLLAFSTSKDQEGFDRYFVISSDGKLTELSDKREETDL